MAIGLGLVSSCLLASCNRDYIDAPPYQNFTPSPSIEPKPRSSAKPQKPSPSPKLPPKGPQASPFQLTDQYDKQYNYTFPREKVSVLAFADQKGSSQMEAWIRPMVARYQDKVEIYGVADLSVVPTFMRGFVKGIFKNQVKFPVMLDWEGTATKAYHYQPGQTNLFLINQQGNLILSVIGPSSSDALSQLYNAIDPYLVLSSRRK